MIHSKINYRDCKRVQWSSTRADSKTPSSLSTSHSQTTLVSLSPISSQSQIGTFEISYYEILKLVRSSIKGRSANSNTNPFLEECLSTHENENNSVDSCKQETINPNIINTVPSPHILKNTSPKKYDIF
jgi:hypothetical protein